MANKVTLPDGRTIPDRRRPTHDRVIQRVLAEPLASVAIGLTLAVLAWGTITSNTRNATESHNAAINAKAAADNAEAAKSLSSTIRSAQDQLAQLSTTSRANNYASLGAIQDTFLCVADTLLFSQKGTVTSDVLEACKKPLTPPPSTTTTTR
jgi:endonuclease/exonuclease/phosphatase (EEP) superfamily protein YafD